MTLLSPNHNYAADECIAQIPQHHIPTAEEKVRASETFNKSVLVAAHMAALHDAYIMEMATHPVNEVTIKPSSPTSSIGGLKPSSLKQLKIGKVHRRRVLGGTLCTKTLCTKSHNGLMVVNVFEDEEGNATPIYLCNAMEGNGGSAQAQQLYPQDSKVAVKEPYLTRLPDGEVVLLVEKTTDLVFLWVPENVKGEGGVKGGSNDNGLFENGRDAFTIEKAKDASVNGGDFIENEGKDDSLEVVENKKSNGGLGKADAVADDLEKSSKASRELKFEDVMNSKEEKGDVEIGGDAGITKKLQGDEEENASDKTAMEGDNKGNIEEAFAEEDVKGLSASLETNLENVVDKKGEEVKEEEVETVAAAPDGATRELSLEDMLAMRKGRQDGGNAEEELKEERGENTTEMHEVETREIEKAGIDEETLNKDGMKAGELNQGNLGAPPGDVDAGETATNLRVKGNLIFARGDFNKAASVYTCAAEKARADGLTMEEVLCLSNRAEVWLRLCRNQAAFDDAEAALKLLRECDGVNAGDLAMAKALFRKGRALMGLHKYEDAMRVLQEVLAKAPTDRQLREAAIKCRNRVQHALKPGKRQRAAANRKKSGNLMNQLTG